MKARFCFAVLVSIIFSALAHAITFYDWRSANFTSAQLGNAATSGATADPDRDGMANLHEYAFFGQPLIADTNLAPALSQAAGHLVLTYRERHDLSDVSIRLQGSDTLLNWITYNSVTEAEREPFAGYDDVTLIDPEPFSSNRRFLRLRVELLPVGEPRAPTQLALSVITPSTWDLGWTDPNTTETGYAVEHRLPSKEWQRLVTLSADTGGWQHTSADYQTSITYRVVAIGAGGLEAASAPITLPDGDGDSIPDTLELGENYVGISGTYASDPDEFSSNGSGLSDGWLADHGFNPVQPFDGEADNDGDGLSDAKEARLGTGPHSPDTDGDGVRDPDDGWPRDPKLSPAVLPDVRYAVLPLDDWDDNYEAYSLDDEARVLGLKIVDDDQRLTGLWKPGTGLEPIAALDCTYDTFSYRGLSREDYNLRGISPRPALQSRDGWIAGPWQADPSEPPITRLYHPDYNEIDVPLRATPEPPSPTSAYRWAAPVGLAAEGRLIIEEKGYAYVRPIEENGDYNTVISTPSREYSYQGSIVTGPRGGPGGTEYWQVLRVIGQIDDNEPAEKIYKYELDHQGTWQKIFLGYALPVPRISYPPTWESLRVYRPTLINDEGLTLGHNVEIKWRAYSNSGASGDWVEEIGQPVDSLDRPLQANYFMLGSGAPVVALGKKEGTPWRAVKTPQGWDERALKIWDPVTQSAAEVTGYSINRRQEIIAGARVVRNGVAIALSGLVAPGWQVGGMDINNRGVILATATSTLDEQGQPISSPQPEPVLLLPVELTSEDRLVKGSVIIPEGWSNVSLSFRSTAQGGLDLGTFTGLEPGVTDSPTYIYASEDDILSEAELDEAQAGSLDPRANTQAVVFYRDATDPRKLHFATAFDQAGEIEIALSFGSGATPAVAKLKHTLTAQAETAGLIGTLDQRIQSIEIPEVIDFDLDTDGDGLPDGGAADLITASQPGTMAAPGTFVSETAEDDPLNLVLLVNSDDDNADTQADSANTSLDPADDDLARIVLRAPSGLASPVGTITLTHNGGSALRLSFATGPPAASGTSVNLASPAGPLSGLAAGPVTLYAEGLAPANEVAITLTYTPPTGDPVSDTVRLTVLDPSTLASLQTRHRYFILPGDLGGLAYRSYAANGAYRQHRLGLSPIGANVPIQNRSLLAKSLFSVIGTLKNTAAFYRGVPDGFWIGLKGDWQSIQETGEAIGSAIAFVIVEDDTGRMARAVAFYDQIKEIKKAFDGVSARDIPGIMKNMASTITRDLYTEAEASLAWEPITDGLDLQVINYMGGITVGYVGEQVVIGLTTGAAAAKITTKIAPMVRGVVTAVKNGTPYALDALDDVAKPASWLSRGVQKTARTQNETKAMVQAVQKVKRFEFPDGFTVPRVINDWFKLKPQLYDELLTIWVNKFPADVSGQRVAHMMNDLATVLYGYGNAADFPDDAVKGFAHLQAKLFKTGDDSISRWKDCEKLFGGLDTPAKKNAMKESLVTYKQAMEVNPEAKFVIKSITAIQDQAYRYTSFTPQGGWANFSGSLPDRAEGWWCSFDFYDNKYVATDRLLLPLETSAPLYRYEFATSEIVDKARIGRGLNDDAAFFEPLTRDIPDNFVGGGTSIKGLGSQFKADGVATLQRVIDMNTGQTVWPAP
jgi:hypothetical protein